jgi:hypothetical protein
MDKRIFPEYSGRELVEMLEANSDSAEDRTYYVPLDETELADRKSRFAQKSIEVAKIEERKKEVMDAFKQELEPLIDEKKELLHEIKIGAREEEGVVFKIIDYDSAMVGFYNQHGILIDSRAAMEDEIRQLTIGSARRKTGSK